MEPNPSALAASIRWRACRSMRLQAGCTSLGTETLDVDTIETFVRV